tara:strand:+ start:251 stop:691 length:441 start_codon:yes stop_codon:yes gene_type:complete
MAKVIEIAITKNFKEKMQKVDSISALAGKGLVNDRHFSENTNKKCQITLIEIENIKYYNSLSGSSILPINFRRNIITEGVRLNALVGKEFYIGDVKVKAHDLCRPCKFLQETLKQKQLVQKLLLKGGLRCEILSDGNIYTNSEIKY